MKHLSMQRACHFTRWAVVLPLVSALSCATVNHASQPREQGIESVSQQDFILQVNRFSRVFENKAKELDQVGSAMASILSALTGGVKSNGQWRDTSAFDGIEINGAPALPALTDYIKRFTVLRSELEQIIASLPSMTSGGLTQKQKTELLDGLAKLENTVEDTCQVGMHLAVFLFDLYKKEVGKKEGEK